MKILIQGAGITGLTLVRELAQLGIDFTLVEKAPALKPVGAGITLGANALACLSRTLELPGLVARGQALEAMTITDARGRKLMEVPASLSDRAQGAIAIHRHALHEALLEGISPDRILLGTSIERFESLADSVSVTLSNGRTESYDFLIGADGLRSRVREELFGSVPLRFSGYTCWRAVVRHRLRRPTRATEMWGRGRRFGMVQIDREQVYVFATLNRRGDLPAGGFLSEFSEFGEEAAEILQAVRSSGYLIHNDLEEIALPGWHSGRVLLLGDAAHGMTPNLGQGAAMGIEDASTLARIWADDKSSASLSRFEALRRPRVRWIQDRSREMGRMAQLENGAARWLRDRLLRLAPPALLKRNLKQILEGGRT